MARYKPQDRNSLDSLYLNPNTKIQPAVAVVVCTNAPKTNPRGNFDGHLIC